MWQLVIKKQIPKLHTLIDESVTQSARKFGDQLYRSTLHSWFDSSCGENVENWTVICTLARLWLPYDPNKLLYAAKQHDSEPTHPTHALWFSHHLCTVEAAAHWTLVTMYLMLQGKSGLQQSLMYSLEHISLQNSHMMNSDSQSETKIADDVHVLPQKASNDMPRSIGYSANCTHAQVYTQSYTWAAFIYKQTHLQWPVSVFMPLCVSGKEHPLPFSATVFFFFPVTILYLSASHSSLPPLTVLYLFLPSLSPSRKLKWHVP